MPQCDMSAFRGCFQQSSGAAVVSLCHHDLRLNQIVRQHRRMKSMFGDISQIVTVKQLRNYIKELFTVIPQRARLALFDVLFEP